MGDEEDWSHKEFEGSVAKNFTAEEIYIKNFPRFKAAADVCYARGLSTDLIVSHIWEAQFKLTRSAAKNGAEPRLDYIITRALRGFWTEYNGIGDTKPHKKAKAKKGKKSTGKSVMKEYTRTTKTGKVVTIKAHTRKSDDRSNGRTNNPDMPPAGYNWRESLIFDQPIPTADVAGGYDAGFSNFDLSELESDLWLWVVESQYRKIRRLDLYDVKTSRMYQSAGVFKIAQHVAYRRYYRQKLVSAKRDADLVVGLVVQRLGGEPLALANSRASKYHMILRRFRESEVGEKWGELLRGGPVEPDGG